MDCHHKRMLMDIKESKNKEKDAVFKMRPGWSFKAMANKPLFDRHYVHLDVEYRGKTIQLSIRATENDSDDFVIAVGDKQLVVRPEILKDDARWEAGQVVETHDPLWVENDS